mgnify:CR=1 FL=1
MTIFQPIFLYLIGSYSQSQRLLNALSIGNNDWSEVFHKYYSSYSGYEGIELSNKFNISTTNSIRLTGLQKGETCISNSNGSEHYPKIDRFYGELTDYIPTKNGVANIDLKRTAFGLKFIVTPPVDGTLSVSYIWTNNGSINSNIKLSADDNILLSLIHI